MRAVNLIPEDQRSGAAMGSRSGGAVFLVLGLLAGVVVLAGLYGIAHSKLESRNSEVASLNKQAAAVQAQATRLAPYTTFSAMREARVQAVAQLVGSRFDWSSAMGELSRVLPSDVALTSVQGTIGSSESAGAKATSTASTASTSSSVTSSTPPGATPALTLSGCAASQSVVAQTLVRLRLISGVSAVELQSSTKSGTSAAGGSCTGGDPVFNVEVTFNPLPAVTPTASSSASGASTAGAAGSGSTTTGSTASASYGGGTAR